MLEAGGVPRERLAGGRAGEQFHIVGSDQRFRVAYGPLPGPAGRQMHAAGVRVVSGSDGGIAAAKPHGLLPVSVAFLVEGGVSTVAALASATAVAAAACGLGDRKGRLRADYDADLCVVDGDPVADIGALDRPAAVFAGGRRPARAA